MYLPTYLPTFAFRDFQLLSLNLNLLLVIGVDILEQDTGLEALSHVISRQKAMAVDIGNELDTQNGK